MWMGNHETRKAAFVAVEGQPLSKWPARGFHADSSGGSGCDCLGTRYEVLANEAPAWQAVVLAAAVAAKMPLMARQVGKAGKYGFWVLCAANPAEAQAESARLMAEWEHKQADRAIDDLLQYCALPENFAVLMPDGDVVLAQAVRVAGRRGYCGSDRQMVVDRKILPYPVGAEIVEF
jgi:hypothetical protein